MHRRGAGDIVDSNSFKSDIGRMFSTPSNIKLNLTLHEISASKRIASYARVNQSIRKQINKIKSTMHQYYNTFRHQVRN